MIKIIYASTKQTGDIARNGKNLLDDPTLETAVLISLFCRRLAEPDDILPTTTSPREGWWADQYSEIADDRWGSRLWLLNRAKPTQETLTQAQEYAIEALAWLVEDGVAKSVECDAEWQVKDGNALLALNPIITKPNDPTRWSALWLANLALL